MRACEVTCGPHYDADATIEVPKLTRNSFYILFPAEGIMNYRKINYGCLCVGINNLTFVTGGGGPIMHENVALINKYTQLQFCF